MLRSLPKDNSGYDLKQVFIGSEGTLGIVTAASLKLFPKPEMAVTAFAAVPSPAAALKLLGGMQARHLGSAVGLRADPARGAGFRHPPYRRHP